MELRESEILNSGKRIFNTLSLRPNHVVAIYFGTLEYENLTVGGHRRTDVYGEGAMGVMATGGLKWGMKRDFNTPTGCKIQVYPAPSCPCRFLKETRYTTAEARRTSTE